MLKEQGAEQRTNVTPQFSLPTQLVAEETNHWTSESDRQTVQGIKSDPGIQASIISRSDDPRQQRIKHQGHEQGKMRPQLHGSVVRVSFQDIEHDFGSHAAIEGAKHNQKSEGQERSNPERDDINLR